MLIHELPGRNNMYRWDITVDFLGPLIKGDIFPANTA